jgi:hypothetical protein
MSAQMIGYTSLSQTSSYLALESYNDEVFSVEAFNAFHSILDAFGRILNNFKTYLLKGFKGFKRSELTAYEESHRLLVSNILKGPIHYYSSVEVPIPDGMKVPYDQATTMLVSFLEDSNFKSMIDQMLIYLDLYKTSSIDEYSFLKDKTITTMNEINYLTEKKMEAEFKKSFSGTHTPGNVPISNVLSSLKEVRATYHDIKKFEKYYMLASSYFSKINDIEKLVHQLISQFEKVKLNQEYLKAFHSLILTCARQIDYFGVLLDTSQRVEHNFIYVLHRLGVTYKNQKN